MALLINQKVGWEPSLRQAAFIEIPDSIDEALFGGQAGGGKTDCLLNLPVARQWILHPRFKGIIFRRTFPELEREIIARANSQGLYKAFGCKYNKDRKRWEHKDGGILAFGHCQYDEDIKSYDSDEYNYIAFDELTTFNEYMYLYMLSRNRSSASDLPSVMRAGTNPGGVGNLWVRERFVEPAREGNVIIRTTRVIKDPVTNEKREFANKRIFIPSRLEDNPHIVDPTGYRAKLMEMPEKERQAKLYGDWYVFGGQIFTEYRDSHLEEEPEHANHVCEPFDIPLWWPRILAVDWGGGNAETVALWGAIAPSGRLYVYREKTWAGAKINEWATDIKKYSQTEIIRTFVLCRSAWQQRGDVETISEQVFKFSGLQPKQSDNRRVAGRLVIHEFLRWKQRPRIREADQLFDPEIADKILRTQGTLAYKEYYKSFDAQQEEINLPRVIIFRTCIRVRQVIPLCVQDDKNPEDVMEFKGDDPYDTFRYLIMEAEEIRMTGLFERQTLEEKRENLVQELKVTQNQTAFYRKMEKLERDGKKVGFKGVRMMHRRGRR